MKQVKDYIGYAFSSGSYTGSDYKAFEHKCKSELKAQVATKGFAVHSFNGNHYCWSAVLERNGRFIYVSMSDVRYWDDWYGNVLVRTMAHDHDWRGGSNCHTSFDKIVELADRLAA